jgi:hypothetical protein
VTALAEAALCLVLKAARLTRIQPVGSEASSGLPMAPRKVGPRPTAAQGSIMAAPSRKIISLNLMHFAAQTKLRRCATFPALHARTQPNHAGAEV